MTRADIEAACIATFEEVIGLPPVRGIETAPADMPEWGSLGQVYLLVRLEGELGIDVDPTTFVFGASLREICDAIERAHRG